MRDIIRKRLNILIVLYFSVCLYIERETHTSEMSISHNLQLEKLEHLYHRN